MALEYTSHDPYASDLVAEAFFKPMMPGSDGVNQKKVDELRALLSAKLDVYDTILGKQKYLAGDEYTLADCFVSSVDHRFGCWAERAMRFSTSHN